MKSIKSFIKQIIVKSGIPPLRRLEYFNEMLSFGQWLKTHECKIHFPYRFDLYSHINSEVLNERPITYLEFGVATGTSIQKWAELNRAHESVFWGFDSFEGLPDAWVLPKGTFNQNGIPPVINDDRVRFVKGLFHNTLPTFLDGFHTGKRLVVHLDADLYASTLLILTSLHRWFVSGTILIFDEFNNVDHEFKAFKSYTTAYKVKYHVLASSGSGYSHIKIDTQVAIEIA